MSKVSFDTKLETILEDILECTEVLPSHREAWKNRYKTFLKTLVSKTVDEIIEESRPEWRDADSNKSDDIEFARGQNYGVGLFESNLRKKKEEVLG